MSVGLAWVGLGALAAAAGGVAIAVHHADEPGWSLLWLAYGAVGLGLVQMSSGLWSMLTAWRRGRRQDGPEVHPVPVRAMVEAMIGMALADGRVVADEVATIGMVYHRLTGGTLEPDLVLALAAAMQRQGIGVQAALARLEPALSAEDKAQVVRAAYLVLRADGVVDAAERSRLIEIVRGLGLSESAVLAIVDGLQADRDGTRV